MTGSGNRHQPAGTHASGREAAYGAVLKPFAVITAVPASNLAFELLSLLALLKQTALDQAG